MRELALQDSDDSRVRQLAIYLGSPIAIESFLRQSWIVRPDPIDAEYIEGPVFQVVQFFERGHFAGDCDDAATLAAALLHAAGWPCSLVAYRLVGAEEFSHVNVHCGNVLVFGEDLEIDPVTPLNLLPIQGAVELMEVPL